MTKLLAAILLSVLCYSATAQQPLPSDYLSKEFHKGRREALRKLMPANSVAVVFAYPERVFSKDVNYAYHPNPDLYYFSGYKEPNAVLLIFKETQQGADGAYNELFFVQKRNALQERWTGKRLGIEGVKEQLGFTHVYNDEQFANYPLDLTRFSKILYDAFPDDAGAGMLQTLIDAFKKKAGIQKSLSKNLVEDYTMLLKYTTAANLAARVNRIKSKMEASQDQEYKTDPLLNELMQQPDSVTLVKVLGKLEQMSFESYAYNNLVGMLREIKTTDELVLMRKSSYYSAMAHVEVMKAIHPAMSETELMGTFEYVHKKYGAEGEGYPPIVGAGANGCILHYIENNVTQVNNQLVLMDVASEYHGYSSDVTRTVPANGKFTAEQRAIYQLVYDAQEAVFKLCKEGTPFRDLNIKATEILANGLLKLGIIKDAKEVGQYYIHGVSHHVGLDVHDKFSGAVLKENMVITVEPGLYIPKGSNCDPKWWDIAVRIEDVVVIGKTSGENISAAAPRTIDAIEKMAAQKSKLNDLVLPKF